VVEWEERGIDRIGLGFFLDNWMIIWDNGGGAFW